MGTTERHAWVKLAVWSFFIVWTLRYESVHGLGVNWGTQASHPLPPKLVVQMLKNNNIQKVKLFDSDNAVLKELAGTNIQVMVAIPNNMLQTMTDAGEAQDWVSNNVVRYMFPGGVNIKYVAVGNEPFLATYNGSFISLTYPALYNIQTALNNANLGDQVKATVPLNADVLTSSSVPSQASFRAELAQQMTQIVSFLHQNSCPFTINIYPFISLYQNKDFPVDFAFFDGTAPALVDGVNIYKNVFDASYDNLVVTLANAGYSDMPIIVGEIGWPTDGDVHASNQNALRFNQGFLNHVLSNVGTPRRPNTAIDFYLFSLIDEDQKSIAPGNFERHWGIFRFDGQTKYALSLSGSNNGNLVGAQGVEYLPRRWCVLNGEADSSNLPQSITYACSNSDCTSLGYGCSCNTFLDANGNASYAFNQYYQVKNQDPGACYFGGLGQIVTQDPSVNICLFTVQLAYGSSSAQASFSWLRSPFTSLISALIGFSLLLL